MAIDRRSLYKFEQFAFGYETTNFGWNPKKKKSRKIYAETQEHLIINLILSFVISESVQWLGAAVLVHILLHWSFVSFRLEFATWMKCVNANIIIFVVEFGYAVRFSLSRTCWHMNVCAPYYVALRLFLSLNVAIFSVCFSRFEHWFTLKFTHFFLSPITNAVRDACVSRGAYLQFSTDKQTNKQQSSRNQFIHANHPLRYVFINFSRFWSWATCERKGEGKQPQQPKRAKYYV